MRELKRPAVKLPTLEKVKEEYSGSLHLTPSQGGPPENKWTHADVRGALFAMHNRTCAYCQNVVSDHIGDVEHFRPKSEYRWLQYEFFNYLLACRICNSYKKGKKFPIADGTRLKRDDIDVSLEHRLLLDPSVDHVESLLRVALDTLNSEVHAVSGLAVNLKAQVDETIALIDLNDDPRLYRWRANAADDANDLLDRYEDGETNLERDIRRLASRYQPHGWTVRQVIAARTNSISLPTRDEELAWYLEWLIRELRRNVSFREPRSTKDEKQREDLLAKRDEISWTLAILWFSPPTGSQTAVGDIIDAAGLLDHVTPNFKQLVAAL